MLGSGRARTGPHPYGRLSCMTSASSSSRTRSCSPIASSPTTSGRTVRLHPEQGAKLVRRIEGYGPVADIILCHHERFDGNGYTRVALKDIPLGSRIIAARGHVRRDDVARDSYRRPVSSRGGPYGAWAHHQQPARPDGCRDDSVEMWNFQTQRRLPPRGRRRLRARLPLDRRVEDYARPAPPSPETWTHVRLKRFGSGKAENKTLERERAPSRRSSQVRFLGWPASGLEQETHVSCLPPLPPVGCHRDGLRSSLLHSVDEMQVRVGSRCAVIEHASNYRPSPSSGCGLKCFKRRSREPGAAARSTPKGDRASRRGWQQTSRPAQ